MKIFSLTLGLLLFISGSKPSQDGYIEHHIKVIHPGVSTSSPLQRVLVEITNSKKKSVEFYMDVETVLCSDDQCRIDVIRIYWDTLGFFNRLNIPENVYLEKAQGEHFNKDDNDKLTAILADRGCSLSSVYKDEVVGTESSDGVDGVSGATIILNTNDYVKGAVWTCYTLWHWANGDVHSIIRNIRGDRLTSIHFTSLSNKNTEAEQAFLLEQVTRRKIYNASVVEQVLQIIPNSDKKLTRLILSYFELAPSHTFYDSIEKALRESDLEQRKSIFNSLINYKTAAATEYYEHLFSNLDDWNSYDEINRLLTLIDVKDVTSSKIVDSILTLLNHSDFVVARRAYWFLSEQELTEKASMILNRFYNTNQDRL